MTMIIQPEIFFYENMVNIERKISIDIFHCLFAKNTLNAEKKHINRRWQWRRNRIHIHDH